MKASIKIFILIFFCLFFLPSTTLADKEINCDNSPYVLERVTAAFNTQGYWALNDIMGQIVEKGDPGKNNGGKMGLFAPFIYICVILGGLIMVAMGMPPKNYMWWVLGPVLFNFLVFTQVSEDDNYQGVCWKIGTGKPQKMERVWEILHTGILNQNQAFKGSKVKENFNVKTGPNTAATYLPLYFVEFDKLISDQIGFLVDWAGVGNMKQNDSGNTNMHKEPKGGFVGDDASDDTATSLIMSNQKWPLLEDISAAVVNNQDTREALVRFFASECGDELAKFIDKGAYAQASSSRGAKIPRSVFREDVVTTTFPPDTFNNSEELSYTTIFVNYEKIKNTLERYWVPFPPEIRRLLRVKEFAGSTDSEGFNKKIETIAKESREGKTDTINCMQYLYVIVQAFRWESGFLLNQVIHRSKLKAENVAYSFMFGWKVDELIKVNNEFLGIGSINLTIEQQIYFIQALGLLHLFRNELSMMTNPVDRTFSASEKNIDYIRANIGQIGSKNKYGELYVWSKMMPYVQGVALYFLPSFYPFACLLMIIPGWHKSLITWAGMYAWVKSWDAGFAIVKSFERSIWAMLGSTSDMAHLNGRIYANQSILTAMRFENKEKETTCNTITDLTDCIVPVVKDGRKDENGETIVPEQSFEEALFSLDAGMTFAPFLDLDVANAYYVYLMSALYFVVPAVTGQVLLGAKAGMAGMMASMAGGMASEVSKGAGQGATAEKVVDASNNQEVMDQEQAFKKWRSGEKDSLAAKVLGAQAAGFQARLAKQKYGIYGNIESTSGGIRSSGYERSKEMVNTVISGVRDMTDGISQRQFASGIGTGAGILPDVLYQRDLARVDLSSQYSQGLMGVGASVANAKADYMNEMANQTMQAGEYSGREKEWLKKRDEGRQKAGRMGAIGAEGSPFAAGKLPTGLGAAAFGMLSSFENGNLINDAGGDFWRASSSDLAKSFDGIYDEASGKFDSAFGQATAAFMLDSDALSWGQDLVTGGGVYKLDPWQGDTGSVYNYNDCSPLYLK